MSDIDNSFKRSKFETRIEDYKRIRKTKNECIAVADTNYWHKVDVEWLERALKEATDDSSVRNVVVLTHYAPLIHNTSHAVYERCRDDILSQAYRNDLSGVMLKYKEKLRCWCFGHTHHPADFVFAQTSTRVVSHPIGRPGELPENRAPTIIEF